MVKAGKVWRKGAAPPGPTSSCFCKWAHWVRGARMECEDAAACLEEVGGLEGEWAGWELLAESGRHLGPGQLAVLTHSPLDRPPFFYPQLR